MPPDLRMELVARDVERRVLVDLAMGYRAGLYSLWFGWLCPVLTGMVRGAHAELDAETRRPDAPPLAEMLAEIARAEEAHGALARELTEARDNLSVARLEGAVAWDRTAAGLGACMDRLA
jgi:hypothetical protein